MNNRIMVTSRRVTNRMILILVKMTLLSSVIVHTSALPRGQNLFHHPCVCVCVEVWVRSLGEELSVYRGFMSYLWQPFSHSYRMFSERSERLHHPSEAQLDIYRLLIYSSDHCCRVYVLTAAITMQLAYLFPENGWEKHISASATCWRSSCVYKSFLPSVVRTCLFPK